MLNREQVLEIAELFFGGKPEEAYKKVSSMSEWEQFTGSIKKNENDRRARIIMRKSDLSVWDKHTSVIGDDSMYPTYDIGY
ncbi:uroporphyrinogen-III methylase [Peptostreptococcus stomatis]|uniref:uroporphyrinogen-III methylase n=1 Tax=Peptostreptococcus stomatis TaxID=341694 RepID=UPI001A44D5F4|nr:uroporphyrinogen-III methylase [Peptostreptococcus stomatis]MBL6466298.1 uroporphyrinogen-III methylase [Peptostreptococcus stomatis]